MSEKFYVKPLISASKETLANHLATVSSEEVRNSGIVLLKYLSELEQQMTPPSGVSIAQFSTIDKIYTKAGFTSTFNGEDSYIENTREERERQTEEVMPIPQCTDKG